MEVFYILVLMISFLGFMIPLKVTATSGNYVKETSNIGGGGGWKVKRNVDNPPISLSLPAEEKKPEAHGMIVNIDSNQEGNVIGKHIIPVQK
uniref:Secreted protein n=1 Tax=Strongyloides papillosus TaxID=174720 RepID=A0A0N5C130_STREA